MAVARVAFLLAVVLSVAAALFARSAKARLGEALRDFGTEVLELQGRGASLHGGTRTLALNGAELRLVTASTPLGVRDALERFKADCRRRGGLRGVPPTAAGAPPASTNPYSVPEPILLEANEREGVLACLDTGAPLTLTELTARLRRFSSSGDLAAIGEFRYVLARRSGETTTLLALWTEGSFPVTRLFPKDGDAPGADPQAVPRPERSRRLLSAKESGEPCSLTLYTSARSARDLRAFYSEKLRRAGWTVQLFPAESVLSARRAGRAVLLRITDAKSGGQVAVLELG